GMADEIKPAIAPRELAASPTLSLVHKQVETLRGRKVGVLISDGFDRALVEQLTAALTQEHAAVELVAPKIGGARSADGQLRVADHIIGGGPSVIFDAVAVMPGAASVNALIDEPAAIDWVSDAYNHCKVIGMVADAQPLLIAGRVQADDGVVDLAGGVAGFIAAAKRGRVWSREK
ncbi:MAG TPA: catalase HPII, partial [Kofleriaceae bacterium]